MCYGLYDKENIIGFIAVLHQPHPKNRKLKRCSRLVILPDYQGIGLGTKFLNFIAEKYKRLGFEFTIVTSAKNMIHALNASGKWIMTRYSVNSKSKSSSISEIFMTKKTASFLPSMRNQNKTARFVYK